MLISQRHKFIFIHIYKNAGRSITTALLPFAVSHWQLRVNSLLEKCRLPKIRKWDPRPYPDHLTALELMGELGKEHYESLYSFAVIRNPWDWQVSLYTYMVKEPFHHQHLFVKSLGTFDAYIRWRCHNAVRFQKDFIYTPQDELLVNYVAHFENLENDFGNICNHLGVAATLPVLNVSNTKPYQQFYTKETRTLVEKTFAPDIQLFGYQFD